MASIESKLFYILLRFIRKKRFLEMQFAFGKFDFNNSREPPKTTARNCKVDNYTASGRSVFVLSPKNGTPNKSILYLHGGAYVQNFVKQHWKFLCLLVRETGCSITAPDYPLAPTHTFVDAFNMVVPLYQKIVNEAGAENTIVMGDSAGGGFALALCQLLKINNVPQPKRIILLSPWLDITLKNPDIASIDPHDPFLGIQGLRKAGLTYAGDSDPDNFMLSPINGPIEGLGKISIFMGTNDLLVADARKLCALASEKGVHIDYREYKDMVHVWMLLYFRESRRAQKEIQQLISS